ncbi:MAG TPA: RibD family protein, partial [Terriglobales bacterium]
GRPRRRKLLRVILDSRLRLPIESRVVQSCDKDVIVFCSFANEQKRAALEKHGVIVEKLPNAADPDGRPDMSAVFRRLGEREITSVMVEGGAAINAACLTAGVIDKLWLFYAPRIVGGEGAVPFLSSEARGMSGPMQLKNIEVHRFGNDLAVEGYLRDPYE